MKLQVISTITIDKGHERQCEVCEYCTEHEGCKFTNWKMAYDECKAVQAEINNGDIEEIKVC